MIRAIETVMIKENMIVKDVVVHLKLDIIVFTTILPRIYSAN